MNKKGRVTVPTDAGFVEGTKKIAALWGADAVRDCDGTVLPDNVSELGRVYNTYFVVRGDNEWARAHEGEVHRTFLISERVTATGERTEIEPMKGYFADQIAPDWSETARWQVFDRTTGEEHTRWTADEKRGVVVVEGSAPYHEYTVNFMARLIWHPVQIYNYLTNGWTCEKQRMYDPAYPQTADYILRHMREWCAAHPETDVVRFTTFLYQFTLIFNEQGKEKYVDWFGYTLAASPAMLDAFEREYGYALTSEDIVDGGCYNNPFRMPKRKFLDFLDFVCRFVARTVRKLTDIVHESGKEAMMFLGDDWIGAEPYGKYFKDLGLDAVVGSVGGGVTVRMLSDIEGVKYREGRLLPYFFPDTFFEGNEDAAVAELARNWATARRAMMRKPLDRIGFGGYLSLAASFPKFVEKAAEVCDEFRAIADAASERPYSGLTVAVLNCWGKLRSWQSHMVAHELWYREIYSYQGVLEALSGLPVNVKFISFDDIAERGIDSDIDVIINVGAVGTAYSGGDRWRDPALVATVRKWVADGHGFVGVGEPTAVCGSDGRGFALADVLGTDIERGFTLSEDKYNIGALPHHFITEDVAGPIDYGEAAAGIYALPRAAVLDIVKNGPKRNVNVGEVRLAANDYFGGRGVYIAGLPYSPQNARLLLRALYFAAGKESDLRRSFASSPFAECHYYPKAKKYALVNNSDRSVTTDFFDISGAASTVTLAPLSVKWIKE